jgi:asparagine synthase (glutamine-hydrolysing)
MCGIAGIVDFNPSKQPGQQTLERMVDAIRHRGPDERAVTRRGSAGLGIARLAIIDPEGSHQPIANEDNNVFMVFNGEIYNYKALRGQLEESGHRFATNGDGEAVVHGYEEWGTGVFERLRGMFAVAIWDDARQRLLLARDRLGIKPLYVSEKGSRLVFASEIKSMLEAGIEARFRHQALECYLAFRYVAAPDTVFDGIHKIPPGTFVILDEHGQSQQRFHHVSLRPKHDVSEPEAIDRLLQLLVASVEYRLQSDVPLGVFLSGGLDSGFLVALARMHTGGRLDTFSIGFNRGGIYDETQAAAIVARHFSTDQHSVMMDHVDFASRLPWTVYYMDEPMGDPSSVPMHALSELASRHVKVVLSGEGGDELFAGYPRYFGESLAARLWVPQAASRWIARGLRRRASRSLRRGIEGIGITDTPRRHLFWQEIIPAEWRRRLLAGHPQPAEGGTNPLEAMAAIVGQLEDGDDMDRLFYYDLRGWLVEDLLLKKDKMGMSASIEARVPYLDQDVVDYALKLPTAMKIRGRRGKRIFRKLLHEHLPREILDRPKVGFAVPIESWFRHELAVMVSRRLTAGNSFLAEVLDPEAVKELLRSHMDGEDLSMALYSLLVLELWGRIFMFGESPEELSLQLRELV